MATDDETTILALMESTDLLQDENSRLRNSNNILRNVIRKLRDTLAIQKKQLESIQFNDDTFKAFCNGEFDAVDTVSD